ncbi:putative Ufm1-specific protease-like [Dorcoceras hygrometricum]|uniref:Putative Ufm1-specific protease-like n=1 Tax=Dorcoceras hygrometricum TaxID=472368 RepID=A0A2Z7CSF6_9LAMI|nr:putative Ufm1-specific protease-like [Dorcoceras hygrometricum]
MKRRRAGESADGLAFMTSLVTSSYSADDLREQSQESADARGSDIIERQSSRKLLFTSRCYLEIAIAKRCRLHKLIRQRFAIQQMLFALITSLKDPVASYSGCRRKQQQHPVESLYESAVATHPVIGKSSRELQYPVAGKQGAKNPVVVMDQQRSS